MTNSSVVIRRTKGFAFFKASLKPALSKDPSYFERFTQNVDYNDVETDYLKELLFCSLPHKNKIKKWDSIKVEILANLARRGVNTQPVINKLGGREEKHICSDSTQPGV